MKSRLLSEVSDHERGATTSTVRPEGQAGRSSARIKMKVLRREADGSSTSYLPQVRAGARFWCRIAITAMKSASCWKAR